MNKKIFKYFLNLFPRPILIKFSYAIAPIISIYYKGNKYTDPIDGKSYRKFLPYGYGNVRNNVLAPGTLSLERHRLMWLYLQRDTNFFTSKLKVLSIAPEQCFLKRFKSLTNIDYITADLYSPIVDVKADILNLPFKDNEFDVIFCNHVLEHIEDDAKAISELYRTMKPGGWGIFQVPMRSNEKYTYEDFTITKKEDRKLHFGQYDHVRWYGLDYFKRLEKGGFQVEQVKYYQILSLEEIDKYALSRNEILPVVRKPKLVL
ncbi:class I SAM-dependent methyltransferase [Apibacter muscae]|uniref:Class I SAM-dependent methyltransferase n=1 Tax=Apibacter muscae TaxID=2509004 RepID=A0A563DDR1_9FLAO|nr:class I SAM-dependent methyltransferase [Apibacter muscae]TWP28468.1 class I SAM-dependent methyltransferase [Apibacter muscae]TWP30271.1 class I SAM-dependent methyltransferase [Apibacter muscae]